MAAGHRRLRAAVDVEARHLEGRDRDRQLLAGDVVDPGEGRRRRPQLGDILVRHHHDLAALERLRHEQAGVGRMRETPGWCCICETTFGFDMSEMSRMKKP